MSTIRPVAQRGWHLRAVGTFGRPTGHHWLRVRLEGRLPNRDAIGAWVELSAGGVTQRRQVMPTRSYLSQVERTVTFGLGTADRVDSLKVLWPDGSEQMVEIDEVDVLRVIEQNV